MAKAIKLEPDEVPDRFDELFDDVIADAEVARAAREPVNFQKVLTTATRQMNFTREIGSPEGGGFDAGELNKLFSKRA